MKKIKDTLASKLKQVPHFTTKITLQRYKFAVDSAEDVDNPNRYDLLEIYNDIVKDPHLSSLLKHRKTRIKGLQYNLYKESGRTANKSLTLFQDKSFSKFIEYALDAMFYGNSLIEIQLTDNGLEYLLIPRYNIIPEKSAIKYYPLTSYPDFYYNELPYSNTLVNINNNDNNKDLGELLDVSKLILFKNEMLLNWSQYIELFGQPWRIATTNSTDPMELDIILQSLKDVGRSGYFIKDANTTLELLANSSNSQSLYESFAKYIDEQVSKKILGATMITDSGASLSQSQVHLASSYIYTKADIKFIEDVINYQLIPKLTDLGLLTEKVTFAFTEPEIVSIDEKIRIDTFLLEHFNIKDIEYFENRYGVAVEFKELNK